MPLYGLQPYGAGVGKEHKTAFITGITGQDGAYLAELLLSRGYEVHGLVRWDCVDGTQRLQNLGLENIHLHFGDLTDANNITALIKDIWPDEIYNLAALSHVQVSFQTPASAFDVNAKGTLNILDSIRLLEMQDYVRVYQASSSEMFGSSLPPQNEDTKMEPCSPYGAAKLAAYHLAKIYRDSYGIFVSNGILFNHESPLRGEDFVTRKIARAAAMIEAGRQERLSLGNLESVRDWGHARDYVEGMHRMLQHTSPDDFVLATGEAHSVRECAERAFAHIGMKIQWRGSGLEECGIDARTGRIVIGIDAALFRPKEVHYLLGDAAKARRVLGWRPKVSFDALIGEMINAERAALGGNQEAHAWRMAG